MPNPLDSPSYRALQHGRPLGGVLAAVGTGTTNAAINTASLVSHGVVLPNGNPVPAANLAVLALPTSNAGGVYQGAAPTATQIDIRSAVASVPYVYFVFIVG